jgi:HEAT repeat protein
VDLLASLLEDLRSPDAGVRFSVLSRLETLTWTPELAAALRQRTATETDPATRFHLDLLIQFGDTASPPPAPGTSLAALTTLLATPDPDWLQVGLLLRRTPADELPLVMPLVRERGLGSFPDRILPFVLRLFRQHGSREDVPALEALTRHPSPRVILAAVEALERLDPAHLGNLITPLLRHPSPGIKSVAIRLLFRIDPPQAQRHFEALLFSEDPGDREAALFHAYFFPFPQIVQILLRFLSLEEDPALIRKAGRLFIINPAPELPERLIDLLATSRGDKQRELKIILQGVVEFLIKAGLSTRTAEEWRADLIALYRDRQAARWLGEATRLLGSPDEATRRAGVARLADLSRAGHQPARAALQAHAAREPAPTLQATIAALLAEATATEPAPENPPVAGPPDEGPTSPHERPVPDPAIALRDRLWRDFRRAPPAARPGVLRMLVARAGPAALELCREGLTSPDPVLVGAALEGLTALAPDDLPTLLIERLPTAPLEVQPLFVKALAPLRKSAALEAIRQLLFSVQPARRLAGIQAAATLDRPAVQEIVVQAFTRESASDVFQGLADLLLSWMDEELFRTLAAHWPSDCRPAPVAAFLQQAAATLATAHPARFASPAAVLAQLDPLARPPPSPSAPRADYDLREVVKTRPIEPPTDASTEPLPPPSALAGPTSPPLPPTDGSGDLANWADADPVTRFQMLARLGTEPATPARLAEARHWLALETEPISRFHLELTCARWAAAASRPAPPATPLATLETALASPVQRALDLALALEQMPRRDRTLAMDLLREAGWNCLPTPLLPFVLAFVRRAGSPADGPTVEAFCHHDDPRIVLAAIEALEALNPEDLKPLLPFFLVHAHRAIRLRAIRLLDKWDRPEALAHLAATLAAEDPAERAAALDQALLLPFPAVKPLLLRFLGLESDPALVAKAGRLFQINPDPEVPVHLAELLATSGPERRRQLSGILSGVLTALAAAGLVPDSPAEQLERLTVTVKARRQARDLEHCRAALTASTPEARLAGVRLAAALAEEGLPGLLELIRAQAAGEEDPAVAAALRTLLAHLQSSPTVDGDVAERSAGPAQPFSPPPATAAPTLPTTGTPGPHPSPQPPTTVPGGPPASEPPNTAADRSGPLPPAASPLALPPEAPDPDGSPAARAQWINALTPLTFPAALPRLRLWLDTLPDARQSAQQGGAPAASAKPEGAAPKQEAQPAAKQAGQNSKNGKAAKQPKQNAKEKK